MKPSIYITRKLPEGIIKPLKQRYEVTMWEYDDVPVPSEVLRAKAQASDALLTMVSDVIDESILSDAENLKVIANNAVGYNNIDLDAANKRGIVVCNTPDVLTDTTADLTFGLLLAAARRMVEAADYIKNGQWKAWSPFLLAGQDVHHKTIGIVGMGRIGETLAKRATGFDMKILYHNRTRKPEAEKRLGAVYVPFEELIEASDFVVALTPLTEDTKHLFSRGIFKRMKPSAIFINASRGSVVDEKALYEALEAGEIAGAGLDVFEQEPIDAEHPLLKLPNVTAMPHIGSSSMETRKAMLVLCVENIVRVLEGKQPKTLVNNV